MVRDQPLAHGGTGYGRPSRDDSATDLSGYLSLLLRRKWIIVPFVVLIPLVAWVHAAEGTRVYESSAEVLLNRQSQALTGLNDLLVFQPERVIRTQASIARLPVIAQRVVEAARLERGAGAFLAQSSVGSDEKIDLLTFRVRDVDPALATQLANLYAQKYLEYRRELDTSALREALLSVRKQIGSLEAQGLSVDSGLYSSLVQKQEQLRSAQTLQKSNALLVRQATGAGQVEPQPRRSALLALAVGLVLGLGLAFLVDALDTRVRVPEELADELGLTLLGSVPEPPSLLRRRSALVMLEKLNSPEAELFRILRTTLDVTALAAGCRSIIVTSALKGEGKSTTAANLAIALARAGRHVVLVDLDIRRPSLDSFFKLDGRPGITDVVFERASVEEAALRLTFDPSFERSRSSEEFVKLGQIGGHQENGRPAPGVLEVIGSGTPPPNPGEFMVTSRLDETLEQLQERADLLVVDGPPLLLAGDALTLSSKVDALLLVARMNTFRRGQIGELHRALAASPAVKLGLVATDHSAPHRRAYYGAPAQYEPVPELSAHARRDGLLHVFPAEEDGPLLSPMPRVGSRSPAPIQETDLADPELHSEQRSARKKWA